MSNDVEREAVRKTVHRMLADKETGPALLDDLKGGLSAMPIWMQEILRGPLFDAAAGDRG
jgi:hypothetical protein